MFRSTVALVLATLLSAAPSLAVAGQTLPPAGTKIVVRMVDGLSSATANTGEPVALEVASDVTYAGGVIPKGTRVVGFVIHSQKAGRAGKKGAVHFTVQGLQIGESVIPLSVVLNDEQQRGDNPLKQSLVIGAVETAGALAYIGQGGGLLVAGAVAGVLAFKKGKEHVVPAGTMFDAYTALLPTAVMAGVMPTRQQ